MSAAFDTIDADLLVEIREKESLWFKNYLSDNMQCVAINNDVSGYTSVRHGVLFHYQASFQE